MHPNHMQPSDTSTFMYVCNFPLDGFPSSQRNLKKRKKGNTIGQINSKFMKHFVKKMQI